MWQLLPSPDETKEKKWQLIRSLTPLRLGKSLSSIPFIFHGASHSRPDIERRLTTNRVAESAEALASPQAGEGSVVGSISTSVTFSMNAVLRWVYWWHSTENKPEDITAEHLNYTLNTDFDSALLSAVEIQALVAAWQSGAISQDTLLHNLRTGEILPTARTNEQEMELIRKVPAPAAVTMGGQSSR